MLAISQEGNLAVIHMQYGKANVMDVEFCERLVQCFEDLRQAPSRALLLTGQGSIFSAGVDLRRVLDGGPAYLATFLPALCKAFETVFFFPQPVIAAVNGHAIAGGCILACAADYRVMAQHNGRIGVPELLVGVPFPTIALEILRFVAAPQFVQTLLYRGTLLAPTQAVESGLVDAVVAPEALLEHAREMAETLAQRPPAAFALTKQQLRTPIQQRLHAYGHAFDATMSDLWTSAQTLEAIRTYVARTLTRSNEA